MVAATFGRPRIIPWASLCLQLFARVVGLDRLSLDNHTRVGFLPVLGLGCHGSSDVTGCQPESRSKRCEGRYQHRDDDFNDLLLVHNISFLPPFHPFLLGKGIGVRLFGFYGRGWLVS